MSSKPYPDWNEPDTEFGTDDLDDEPEKAPFFNKHKRTKYQHERDLVEVEKMYLRGLTIYEISKALAEMRKDEGYTLSFVQIWKDIEKLIERWKWQNKAEVSHLRAMEVAKITQLERTSWEAWENSLKVQVTQVFEEGGNEKFGMQTKRSVKRIQSTGDPRFLAVVERCIERRSMLLGLDAPKMVDIEVKIRQIADELDLDPDELVRETTRAIASYR